jgi:hypothetical protein
MAQFPVAGRVDDVERRLVARRGVVLRAVSVLVGADLFGQPDARGGGRLRGVGGCGDARGELSGRSAQDEQVVPRW